MIDHPCLNEAAGGGELGGGEAGERHLPLPSRLSKKWERYVLSQPSIINKLDLLTLGTHAHEG